MLVKGATAIKVGKELVEDCRNPDNNTVKPLYDMAFSLYRLNFAEGT